MNIADEFSVLTDEDVAILARNLPRSEAGIIADRRDYTIMTNRSCASDAPTIEILDEIERLQNIQKRHAPTSSEWIAASRELKPLFEEMARRQSAPGLR